MELRYNVRMLEPTIVEHLEHANWWKHLGGGQYLVRHFSDALRGEYTVSMSDLMGYDKRLELLMPFLTEHARLKHRDGTLSNAFVYWTLKHLDGAKIPAVDLGNKLHYVELVTSFAGPVEDTPHKTIFMSHTLTTSMVPGSSDYGFKDDVVLHVEGLGMQEVALSRAWLNEHFSGWDKRYNTGKVLGLDSWALSSFVFDEVKATPPVEMTNLSF